MRVVIHVLLAAVGFGTWCAAMWLMAATTALAVLGDKVLPNATHGNCWTFALPRWHIHGGYLLVRNADGQRFLGFLPVPHVAWVKHLGNEALLEQFDPITRHYSWWMPWFTIYYAGRIKKTERQHDST
jgi:hypothetical protein